MPIELFFSVLGMFLTLTGNFMSLKPSFLTKALSAFVILYGLWSTGCTYLTIFHLKHSFSLMV